MKYKLEIAVKIFYHMILEWIFLSIDWIPIP